MSNDNNNPTVVAKRVLNMSKEKTPMPELSVQVRVKSFDEIELGYTPSFTLEFVKVL